ncbi:MAG: AsmA family protein [Alphaproteobacteria bacterium]
MKWLLYGLLGLAVIFVASLFVLPNLIDWNDYRPRFEAQLTAATGFEVRLKGPISASLLPRPRLILTQVDLSDPDAVKPKAGIRWIGVDASFPALLQGKLHITGITVIEPVVDMAGFTSPGANGETASTTESAAAAGEEAPPFDIRIKGPVDVSGGTVVWATGESSTDISGSVDVDGSAGRIAGNFSATHRETPFDVAFRLSGRALGEEAQVQTTITPRNADAEMEVSGGLVMAGPEGLQFDGSITAAIEEPSAALKPWLPDLAPVLASSGAVRVETTARLTDKTMDFQSIRFESPGGSGSGYVTLNLDGSERTDINLRFSRLDIDALRSQSESESTQTNTDNQPEADQLSTGGVPVNGDASTQLRAFGASGMDATLRLSADAVRLNGSLIRNAVIRASVDDGSVTMEEFAALLPGGSSLSLAGFGTITPTGNTFEGNMSVRADDLRRLMSWAELRIPDVAADRLRSLDFVSGVKYAGDRLDLVDGALSIDGIDSEISAAIALRKRPGIGLRLSVERLNLDAYRVLNDDTAATAQTVENGQSTEQSGLPVNPAAIQEAPAFDAIIDLTVEQLIVAGVPIKALKGRVEYRDGRIRSDALTFADAGGLAGSAMGEFDIGLAEMPGSATVRGHAEDLGALAAVLGASDTIATRIRRFGESDVTAIYEQGRTVRNMGFEIAGANGTVSADLSWRLQGATVETKVENGALAYGMLDARNIGFLAVSDSSGEITVSELKGTVNGGVLTGILDVAEAGTGYEGQGHIAISDIPVGLTLEGLRDDVQGSGSLSVEGDISFNESSNLPSEPGFHIDGDVSGALSLTIPDDSQSAVRVARIEQVRDILRRSFSVAPQPVQGRFTANDSAISTDSITITAVDGARISISGHADFSTQSVAADVRIGNGSDAAQTLAITGPLTKPSLRLSD